MNAFKGRHFTGIIILWAVRWYCKYGISYRELQEMLAERGVNVEHTTIYRWVQRYAPEIEKRLRWYWCNPSDLNNWHLDETYLKVKGKWAYLYRAVDSRGHTGYGALNVGLTEGFAIIDKLRAHYPVTTLCQLFERHRSSYRHWHHRMKNAVPNGGRAIKRSLVKEA